MSALAKRCACPTALIAEDEPLLAQALRAELQRAWPELQLCAQAMDGERALELALSHRPDICFLDIRMPAINGLDLTHALIEDWPEDHPLPLIVFVTAYDQYAIQAFDAQAVDYLLKPIRADRLARCVTQLQQRLAQRDREGMSMEKMLALLAQWPEAGGSAPAGVVPGHLRVIQATVGHVVHMVPIEAVLYFEAADKYVRVITAQREYLIRTALRELLPQLDPQQFWQVHRSVVVRASAIATAARMASGKLVQRPETLAVSRLYAHRFKGM